MRVRRSAAARLAALALAALAAPLAAQQEDAAERAARQRAEVEDIDPAVDFSRAPRRAQGPARPAEPPETPPAPAPAPRSASARSAAVSGAVDTLDLGTTSITGNQELPRVLYIVPWKQSDLGDLVGRPVDTLLDEVLAPIDPEVFERHVSYYETLHGESQED